MGEKDHLPTPEESMKKRNRDLKKITSTAYIGNPPVLTRGIDAIGLVARTTGEVRDVDFPILFDVDDQTAAVVGTDTYDIDLSSQEAHFHRLLLDDNSGAITEFTINLINLPKNKELEFILDIETNFTGNPNVTFDPEIDDLPDGFPLLNESYFFLVSALDSPIITQYRVVSGGSSGTTEESTFVSAYLSADQSSNIAVNNHIEFDSIATPKGADGGITLQVGTGQANGIFELLAETTYFLTASVAPEFSGTTTVEFAWYDITNSQELGLRSNFGDATLTMNQPSNQIIVTPDTDITVELRLVSDTNTTLTNIDANQTFASIFTFHLGVGSSSGTSDQSAWHEPVRAKTTATVDTTSIADVQDGVTLVENDRILLTEQTTSSENGIYDVGVVTSNLAPLTRSSDLNASSELVSEIMVAVEEGTLHQNQVWHLTSDNPLTIDSSAQVWAQFGGAETLGPDLGQDDDGFDAAGQFVLDGRIATGAHITKRWEIGTAYTSPNNGVNDMIYLPAVISLPSRIIITGDTTNAIGAAYSDDMGDTWSSSSGLGGNYNYVRLAFDPAASIVVVVSSDGLTTNIKEFSTDRGASFQNITSPNTDNHSDIIWSEVDSLFIATCTSTTPAVSQLQGIQTSPDGASGNWTVRTTPAPANSLATWKYIAYSTSLGLYVCLTGANTDVMTSPDAINWTIGISDTEFTLVQRIIWSEGQSKFVATGRIDNGDDFVIAVYTSSNGINWEIFEIPSTDPGAGHVPAANDIVWAPDLSLYVIVGAVVDPSTRGWVWVSNDAETWTLVSRVVESSALPVLQTVIYAEEYGQFIAASQSTTEYILRTFR